MQKLSLTKTYQKYSEYKDSGVEWLGQIPKEWSVGKVKEIFSLSKEKISGSAETNILSLTQKGIKPRDISSNEGQIAATYEGYMHILKGDIVLNPMDLITGFVDSSKLEGIISPAYTVIRKRNKNINSQFYNYFFQKHYYEKIFSPFGVGVSIDHRWTLKDNTLLNFPIIKLDLAKQQQMATFLDQKLSFIDQIIEKKKKLIELLKEKRTAVINQAVTKGLDPKVELVDSGIDWIGQIPKGWRVVKLKYLAKFEYGESLSDDLRKEGTVKVYGSNGKVGFHDKANSLRPVIVIGRKGSYGAVNYSEDNVFAIDTTYYVDKRHTKQNLLWLSYILGTIGLNLMSQDTGVPGLSRKSAYQKLIITPPLYDQEKISLYLNDWSNMYDNLLKSINKSILFLQELKSSLISNVVTGKVKI